jgi:hypothetical protein
MTDKELKILIQLNQCAYRLEKANLVLAGIDAKLYAFSAKQFKSISCSRSPAECINELDYVLIQAPYIDSGAS